jgi:hypothetical protein
VGERRWASEGVLAPNNERSSQRRLVEHYVVGADTSWWHHTHFACCAEVFLLAHEQSSRSGALVNGKSAKDLWKLAQKATQALWRMGERYATVKPVYLLAQGRMLCAKGNPTAAQKLFAQAIYVAENYSMLPLKARACLEIARSCSEEPLHVRQFYAKQAHEIFEMLDMKRMAMQANIVGIRLKPSSMRTSGMTSFGGDLKGGSGGGGADFRSVSAKERAGDANGLKVRSEDIPLVGRDEELGVLMKRAGTLRTEDSVGPVVIEGDAGFGKSALLRTFLGDFQSAFSSFATPLYGNALELEQEIPFHAWTSIICQ